MEGKSSRAQLEREFFDAGLKRYLTESDLKGIKAASQLAQRWSNYGALCGLVTGAIVGFPYTRRFSSTLISTLRQIRSGTLSVPTGATPFSYSVARAHREAADAAGSKGLKDGTTNVRQFFGTTLKQSIVGTLWALFFSAAGRTGGALASTWPAESAIRSVGGDVERIKYAANQVVVELYEAKRTAGSDGELKMPPPRPMDELKYAVDADGPEERTPETVVGGESPGKPAPKANFSDFGTRLNQGVIYLATEGKEETAARSADESVEKKEKSRWEELRGNRQQEPSTWERIRQEQARPAATKATSPAVEGETSDNRQQDFQALLERERNSGDEAAEVSQQKRRSRWI